MRRRLTATLAAVALAAVTLGATFTALCGNGTSCAYNGTEVRPGWQTFDRIRTNFNDHETRISAAIVGLSSSVEKEIALFDGTTGKLLERATGTGFVRVTSGVYQTPTAQVTLAELPTGLTQAFTTVVTLTDAQIKALPTTPITLVAAQGSGFRVRVLNASLIGYFSSGAYGNVNTTYASLQIETAATQWQTVALSNDSTTTPALTRVTQFFATAQHRQLDLPAPYVSASWATGGDYVQPVVLDPSQSDNQLIRLAVDNNGSGAFTGGNAANTLKVTLYWVKEAL